MAFSVTILGCGFSGIAIAQAFARHGMADVVGTRRTDAGLAALKVAGIDGLLLDGPPQADVIERLARTTHLLTSVAPAREPPLDDPMLAVAEGLALAGRLPAVRWIRYLSSIGVYGDHDGAWVNENSVCRSIQPRSMMRREAEKGWRQLGESLDLPVSVLRLSGIYGPGRNAVRDALDGRVRMLIKPGQVFNRVHVDDLASATRLAAEISYAGILNITDDEPAAPQDVIRFAHALIDRPAPRSVDFQTAELSPMARSFYNENKRVENACSKAELGLQYRYPDYRIGLESLLASEHES